MIHIKIKNKSYGELNIFNNAELVINEGEFIAIKGPSGSGKTTLINIIGMLDQDYEGTYIFDGISL
ncbi:MAG TPA: ATP-binding cassette domain-containing protein, partial [Acholeplasma sp.]